MAVVAVETAMWELELSLVPCEGAGSDTEGAGPQEEEAEPRRPNLSPCSRSRRSSVSNAWTISGFVMPLRRSRCSRSICSMVKRGSSVYWDILVEEEKEKRKHFYETEIFTKVLLGTRFRGKDLDIRVEDNEAWLVCPVTFFWRVLFDINQVNFYPLYIWEKFRIQG